MTSTNLLSPGFYLPIHSWRNNWCHPSKLISRYCTTRHILRSSTLSLCIINRSSLRYYGWAHPLISIIYRLLIKPNYNKNTILSDIHRGEYNILPTTFLRPIWDTSTILGLPRRLHTMKHNFVYWIYYFTNRSIHVSIHCMRSHDMQTKPAHPTWKKNPRRMILRHTSTIPHPHRTHIYTKQHIRPNPRVYFIHGVAMTREKADINHHLSISSQPHTFMLFPRGPSKYNYMVLS